MNHSLNLGLLLAAGLLSACSGNGKKDVVQQPTKVADYLWEVTIEQYCDTVPNGIIDGIGVEFNCSAVRNGNYYGRNLDFFINETSEVVVHVPANESRHASVGVALLSQCTDSDYAKGLSSDQLDLLPWMMLDGINDAGLFCNVNVTPYADGGEQPGTNPGKPDFYSVFMIRALLDNCANVDEAIDYISNHNVIGKNLGGYNLHFMVGDPEKNVVVEFINNQLVVKEQYIMTNFYVNLPELTPLACGVERYNILKENYAEGGESMEGMRNLLKRVRYSQAYDAETTPFWNSEYVVDGRSAYFLPLDSVMADPGVQLQIANFKHYKETGEYKLEDHLWFTTHNSTYDIKERKLWLTVREQYEKYYEFKL